MTALTLEHCCYEFAKRIEVDAVSRRVDLLVKAARRRFYLDSPLSRWPRRSSVEGGSGARDLTLEVNITLFVECDQSPCARSFTSFRMTAGLWNAQGNAATATSCHTKRHLDRYPSLLFQVNHLPCFVASIRPFFDQLFGWNGMK